MKRALFVITALPLVLGLSLFVYGGSTLREAALPPAPAEEPASGEKIFEKAAPPPALAEEPVVGEKIFEKAAPPPAPAGDPLAGEKTIAEVAPSPTPAGDPLAGEKIFTRACRVCHRKDMIQNEFVAGKTDQELVEFIKIGGVPDEPLVMRPKGGSPSLTDENLYDIVAYIRSLQK